MGRTVAAIRAAGRAHQPHLPGVPEIAVSDTTLFPRPRSLHRLGGASQVDELRVRRDDALPAQGYRLAIDAEGARLAAADDAGERYGRSTFDRWAMDRDADGRVAHVAIDD